jgi:8-oxo-dGTP pyrophosphatase MutT (NUDIX family)
MKEDLRRALANYQRQTIEPEQLWPAAVLALIYEHQGRPHLVFQKRTDRVDTHKGQVSFPGGGRDPGDPHLTFTALRETHEEIGVHPDHVDVLGELDHVKTISGFHVTPYVGWMSRYPYEWVFSHGEVAYLLEVPLDHLMDPDNFVPDRRVVGGVEHVMPSYRFGDDLIWGATGRMVSNLLEVWGGVLGISDALSQSRGR